MSTFPSVPFTLTNVKIEVDLDLDPDPHGLLNDEDHSTSAAVNLQRNIDCTSDLGKFQIEVFKGEFPGGTEELDGQLRRNISVVDGTEKKEKLDGSTSFTVVSKTEPKIHNNREYFDHSSIIQRNLKMELEDGDGNEDPLKDVDKGFSTSPIESRGREKSTVSGSTNQIPGILTPHPIGSKSHTCRLCMKSFSLKHVYEDHFKIHPNQKPYKCETCGKDYNANNLSQHVRIHTGDNKPHKCGMCGNGFSRKSTRRDHYALHARGDGYICITCGESFNQKSDFTTHVAVHSGEPKPTKIFLIL